jgi:hypothetical protein
MCQVVRPGRSFLRRIIDHTKNVKGRDRQCAVPIDVRRDIEWWREFAPKFNGVSLLYDLEWTHADKLELYTDACEAGYGACFGARWIAGPWTEPQWSMSLNHRARTERTSRSMPYLELLALVLAAATWGHLWRGRKVVFRCDASAVVFSVNDRSSKMPRSMELLRSLHMYAAQGGFDFMCTHIAGIDNSSADALSRGDVAAYRLHSLSRSIQSNATPDATPHVRLHSSL